MTALVACETVLLVLLTVLVAGLLRSHAEILRRLGPAESSDAPPAPPEPAGDARARDVAGTTLGGDAAQLGLAAEHAQETLLAFLSSGCPSCRSFFAAFADGSGLPDGVRLVVVAKDPSRESPSRLRELAGDLPLILSSPAWADYRVPAAPYFVLTAAGRVLGEGSAGGWQQLASMLRDSRADAGDGGRGGERRARRADAALGAAGIGAGDPSLYPAGDGQ